MKFILSRTKIFLSCVLFFYTDFCALITLFVGNLIYDTDCESSHTVHTGRLFVE